MPCITPNAFALREIENDKRLNKSMTINQPSMYYQAFGYYEADDNRGTYYHIKNICTSWTGHNIGHIRVLRYSIIHNCTNVSPQGHCQSPDSDDKDITGFHDAGMDRQSRLSEPRAITRGRIVPISVYIGL